MNPKSRNRAFQRVAQLLWRLSFRLSLVFPLCTPGAAGLTVATTLLQQAAPLSQSIKSEIIQQGVPGASAEELGDSPLSPP